MACDLISTLFLEDATYIVCDESLEEEPEMGTRFLTARDVGGRCKTFLNGVSVEQQSTLINLRLLSLGAKCVHGD